MANVTVEYMILIPMLILQIFLFPYAVNAIMEPWVDSRRELALGETASRLGGSIQQVYLALNHESIAAATLRNELSLPQLIDGKAYTGNVTCRHVVDLDPDSNWIMDITLKFSGSDISAKSSVILGPNMNWQNSTFSSVSNNAGIRAEKFPNGTINLSFE